MISKLLSIKQKGENNTAKTIEARRKNGLAHKGLKHTKKTREKISKKLTGIKRKPFTIEHRKKISDKQKIYHKTKKGKEQDIKNGITTTLLLSKSKVSKAELKLKKYLKENKINFIHQYKFKLGVADFYLPEINTIIQCYGKYWHSKPDYIKRDKKQNKWLIENGYTLLIFCSEDLLKFNDNKIRKILNYDN